MDKYSYIPLSSRVEIWSHDQHTGVTARSFLWYYQFWPNLVISLPEFPHLWIGGDGNTDGVSHHNQIIAFGIFSLLSYARIFKKMTESDSRSTTQSTNFLCDLCDT